MQLSQTGLLWRRDSDVGLTGSGRPRLSVIGDSWGNFPLLEQDGCHQQGYANEISLVDGFI